MKIGVISDTHKAVMLAKKAIEQMGDVEMVLHLGDYYSDATRLAEIFPNIKFEYVKGNCDFGYGSEKEKVIDVCGKKIFMTHGHSYDVNFGYMDLYNRARELDADIVLFGHTHVPTMERIGNVHIINPGSISMPRGGSERSFAVLFIDENKIDYGIYELNGD